MNNKKGFTLIEVIVSIGALGIICAVLLRLFVLAGDTNNKAGQMQNAQVAVSTTIETLNSTDNINDALAALGLTASDGDADGLYTLIGDTCTVTLEVSREAGDYPETCTASALQ